MGEEVDTGRLVAQKEFKLSAQFNAKKAFEQFFAEEEKLVSDSLKTGKFEPNNLKHLPFIPSKSDYPTFKRDESFRKIGAWMTIDEIVKRVFVLNIENHYAFIQKEEKKRFIRNVISYSNLNDVEWGENLVVFKAKNGKIGLEFFSDLET
jgi:methionyl-tRNA formyltransferase